MANIEIIITDVTYDRINKIGTALLEDGTTRTINYAEYVEMRGWIKRVGKYILIEKDYSGYTLEQLLAGAL